MSFSSPAPTPFPLEFKTLPLTNFGIDSIFIPSNIIILVFFVKKFGQKRFCKILYQIYFYSSLPDKPIYLITSFTFISNRNSSLDGSNKKNAKHLISHPYRSPFGRFLSKTVLITQKMRQWAPLFILYCDVSTYHNFKSLCPQFNNSLFVSFPEKKIKLEKRKKGLIRKTLDLSPHPWNQ